MCSLAGVGLSQAKRCAAQCKVPAVGPALSVVLAVALARPAPWPPQLSLAVYNVASMVAVVAVVAYSGVVVGRVKGRSVLGVVRVCVVMTVGSTLVVLVVLPPVLRRPVAQLDAAYLLL